VAQRCLGCGALAVPPKALCPACGADRWEVVPLGGDGEVSSFTVIRVAPARLAAETPYVIVVVRMAEGVALTGRLLDAAPGSARIGLPVRFVAPPAPAPDPPVLAFRPR
jgi:uncharacterized OB-fold protein